jgi:hypothetical protein
MSLLRNLLGGLAGAVTLNLFHEGYRRIDKDAPRVDLVGEEALTKAVSAMGCTPPTGNKLTAVTMAADVVSNSLFYSLIGIGNNRNALLRGAALGLGVGIATLKLTPVFGLNDAPITKTTKTKILTVAWYTLGGLAAGWAISCLNQRN